MRADYMNKIEDLVVSNPPNHVWQNLNCDTELGAPQVRKQVTNARYRQQKKNTLQ